MFQPFRKSRPVAMGLLLAGLTAAAAFAAEPPPAPPPAPNASAPDCGMPGGMDISRMKARGAQMFAMVDTNSDGKITEVEFLAAEPPHGHGGHGMGAGMGMGPGMMAMGPGMGMGPGMMAMGPGMGMGPGMSGTPQDAAAQRQAFDAELFKALDTDGNGQLSPAEFAKAHEVMMAMMKKRAFVHLDSNSDGVLTSDEFPPFEKKMAALDADGDGKVTRDEMHSARSAPPPKPAPPPGKTPN